MPAIDICTTALQKIGHHETLPADFLTNPVSKAAALVSRFYPLARREVLRMAPWTCATSREKLACTAWAAATDYAVGDRILTAIGWMQCTTAGTSGNSAPTWATTGTIADGTAAWTFYGAVLRQPPNVNLTGYTYAYPLPAKCLRVNDAFEDGRFLDYRIEGNILYADSSAPVISYVEDQEDTALWDPLLTDTVATHLASKLAYPITQSHENEVALAQMTQGLVSAAFTQTKREHRAGPPQSDPWMDQLFPERKL